MLVFDLIDRIINTRISEYDLKQGLKALLGEEPSIKNIQELKNEFFAKLESLRTTFEDRLIDDWIDFNIDKHSVVQEYSSNRPFNHLELTIEDYPNNFEELKQFNHEIKLKEEVAEHNNSQSSLLIEKSALNDCFENFYKEYIPSINLLSSQTRKFLTELVLFSTICDNTFKFLDEEFLTFTNKISNSTNDSEKNEHEKISDLLFKNESKKELAIELIKICCNTEHNKNAFSDIYYFLDTREVKAFNKQVDSKGLYIKWVNLKFNAELTRHQEAKAARGKLSKRWPIFTNMKEQYLSKR
ncbi:MAG: hypothetical protein NWR83_12955 [Salibacteraceae bacterium]|nr:hypothetical protein [Salibacteraceae bacterium]